MPARKISAKVIPGRERTEKSRCLRVFTARWHARGQPRGKSRLLLCNKNSLVLPTSAQLFFVGAGLRARPQDFSKGNTGSGKNGKIALPARFHSALARGGAAYANSVCPAAPGNPRRGFPTPKHSTGIFWLPSCAFSPEKNFALCAGRPKTLSLESATFEKVDETLNIIVICFYNFKSGGAD